MKILNLRSAPQVTLTILVLFLFYLSAVKHLEILIIWLIIIIGVILIFSKEKIRNLKSVLGVLPFIIMVLIPFFIHGFSWDSLEQKEFSEKLIIRLMCAMMSVSFISARYSYLYLVEGVLKLGLPNFLNQIIALTFRYFFMIREDVDKTSKAMNARCFDNAPFFTKLSSYGEMIGGFFLKSSDHGEKVYNAMRSRGFTAESKFKTEKINSLRNIAYLIMCAAIFIALTVFDRFAEVKWLF
ncbi:energy-coupling factor transporter transmembrane component T family protein [Treponema pedis]|uniref:Cobalt transporter n=1 Tax=Treponema pedis str. T A4 TaxID=1291379 RepID=S6A1M9_9SPIR|nr:energy-coupling factor transporter transmembrane component T [Treponema pedis]AGT44803.1 cobalt transporter [Treponema pedis str. T A4]